MQVQNRGSCSFYLGHVKKCLCDVMQLEIDSTEVDHTFISLVINPVIRSIGGD